MKDTEKTIRFSDKVGPNYKSHFDKGLFYEDDFLNYVSSLGLDGTYLDIGGNVCNHSIYWALFSRADSIISFEPINAYRKIAEENLALNGVMDKVSLRPNGLSDTSGHIRLSFQGESNEVELKRLDDIPFEGPINILKIDIKGMEPSALRGALALLEQHKPLVYCEVIQEEGARDYLDGPVGEVLASAGYVPTGRVFNHQPTLEYHNPGSPVTKRLRHVSQRSVDLQTLQSSSETSCFRPEGDAGLLIHLDATPRAYITDVIEDFSKPVPNKGQRLGVTQGASTFIEIEAYGVGAVSFSMVVNQYDDRVLLKQEKFYVNRRRFIPLSLSEGATNIRTILDCKGAGYLDLRKLSVTEIRTDQT